MGYCGKNMHHNIRQRQIYDVHNGIVMTLDLKKIATESSVITHSRILSVYEGRFM